MEKSLRLVLIVHIQIVCIICYFVLIYFNFIFLVRLGTKGVLKCHGPKTRPPWTRLLTISSTTWTWPEDTTTPPHPSLFPSPPTYLWPAVTSPSSRSTTCHHHASTESRTAGLASPTRWVSLPHTLTTTYLHSMLAFLLCFLVGSFMRLKILSAADATDRWRVDGNYPQCGHPTYLGHRHDQHQYQQYYYRNSSAASPSS